MFRGKLIVSLAAAVFCLLAVAKSASAQYPTPTGGLFCSTSSVVVESNSSFQFSATLVDISGSAVAGQVVSFSVQSSGGAYLASSVGYTDYSGMASTTVYTGGATGQIVVYANSGGFTCQALVTVPSTPNITCYITQISLNQYSFYIKLSSTAYAYASSYAFGGQTVLVSVVSTGGGASLASTAVVTDGSGSASTVLYTIPTSGVVTVAANANGQVCQASVSPPPPVPAQPIIYTAPPRPVRPSYIAPPYTGDAGLMGRSSSNSEHSIEIIAGIVLVSLALSVSGRLAYARLSKD